jgi:glycosyltransferase involved in cell wall biosynthesis
MKKPYLTIGVPTYNRADLLRQQVSSIASQLTQFDDEVELIVSDNCSPDQTRETVEKLRQQYNFKYVRNKTNIGGNANFQRLTDEAMGEFIWFLADDDLLRDNAVAEVLAAIKSHPEVDCIFVNHIFHGDEERAIYGEDPSQYPLTGEIHMKDSSSHKVEKWEDIILLTDTTGVFTFLSSQIVRLDRWRAQEFSLEPHDGFPTVEAAFGHSCRAARMMVGKPAYYIGAPYMLHFRGAQDWLNEWWPMLLVIRLTDLANFIESLGGNKKAVIHYRNVVFRHSTSSFWKLWLDKSTKGSQYFSAWRMALQYWNYAEFWRMWLRPIYVKEDFNNNLKHRMVQPLWNLRERVGSALKPVKAKIKRNSNI